MNLAKHVYIAQLNKKARSSSMLSFCLVQPSWPSYTLANYKNIILHVLAILNQQLNDWGPYMTT